MNQSNNTKANVPVIVVGSGAAGLAAAFKLKQAGAKVKLIEAAHVVGGKLRSKERNGFLMDQGAFFLPTTHRRMVALAAEAGFANEIDPGGALIAAVRDGIVHQIDVDHPVGGLVSTQLFSLGEKLSLWPLVGQMMRATKCNYDRLPEMAGFDTETCADWAKRELGGELGEAVVGMFMRGMAGGRADLSPYVEFPALLSFLKGAHLIACRGGFGGYATRLSAGIETELNASAKEVVPQGDGVRVTWRDRDGNEHVDLAAGCIVASDAHSAIGMLPGLDTWRKAYMGSVEDKYSIILSVGLSKPPANHPATYMLLPHARHPFISGICADHNKASGRVPTGKGMLTVMPVYDWCEGRYNDPDDKIIRDMVDGLDGVIPDTAKNMEFAEITRWRQRYNPIGHYRELGRFRAQCDHDDTRIQLAGDYFGYTTMEMAVRSGEHAAQALLKSL
jgi:protoporphyrinogen/coproporphyrinogen III oxidase